MFLPPFFASLFQSAGTETAKRRRRQATAKVGPQHAYSLRQTIIGPTTPAGSSVWIPTRAYRNTSKLTFARLKDDPGKIARNLATR